MQTMINKVNMAFLIIFSPPDYGEFDTFTIIIGEGTGVLEKN
jgi:hypothetical protein